MAPDHGISEEMVEKALDYLRDNATESAKARANKVYMEEYRKSLKAQLMKEYPSLAVNGQEREAYAHPTYIEHLVALKNAVEEDAYHNFMREAAKAKIEAFQTFSANHRSMKL